MVGNESKSTEGTMQRSLKLASQLSRISTVEPLRTHWAFAAHAAMALIVIVLCTLTVAALEVFLSGDESLILACGDIDSCVHAPCSEQDSHIPLYPRTFLQWLARWWRGQHESGPPSFSISALEAAMAISGPTKSEPTT
jgi:hypothetical protein